MANTGMRELTTNVGGVIKRIWYAINGTTPTAELMSIDDAGKFKCLSEQITGLAGTGNRMVVADASGNLSAPTNYSKKIFISSTGVAVAIGDANDFRANSIYEITIVGKTPALAGEYKRALAHSDSDGNLYVRTIISGGSGTITIGIGGAGQFTITASISGDYTVLLNNI